MARKGTFIKHILLSSGIGAAVILAAGTANEAHAGGNHRDHKVGYVRVGHNHYTPPRYRRANRRHERRVDRRQRQRMIRRIFRRVDHNRDGWISRFEARRHRVFFASWRRFAAVDRDRNGHISRRELNRHLRRKQRRRSL